MADLASTSSNSQQSQSGSENIYKLARHKSKYKVKQFAIISDDFPEPLELNPIGINKIFIIHDYDNCIQPILQLQVVLPPLIIDYINTNKSKISFLFRFQIIDYVNAAENFMMDQDFKSNGVIDLCNEKFVLFSPDSGKVPNLGEYKSVVETINGETDNNILYQIAKSGENLVNYTKEYSLFLWRESDIYRLRNTVNYVFHNVGIGDAMAGILTSSGFSNVLMVPPDNTEIFGQLIIPPMNLMNVFTFMQDIYGMYDTDITFFSDILRTYVIDKSGKCKAFEDHEYKKTVFTVIDSFNSRSIDVGTATIDLKEEFHNKVDIGDVAIRSLSSIHDIIQGNTNLYIDSRNNEITTVTGAGEQRGEGCINITTDQEGNEFTKRKQANRIAELALNLRITNLSDYNYTALTPNKEFVFSFANKDFYQYNGYYRLLKGTHVFSRDGQGEYLVSVGTFEFARKAALSEEERSSIEMDVFQTAQVTEEGTETAKSKANENNYNDPSYNQSQDNQVAEGKMQVDPAPKAGMVAPDTVPDVVPAKSKAQPFDPNSDQKYKEEEAKKNKRVGSPAPVPLDEKYNKIK